jgi:hypothetical protein
LRRAFPRSLALQLAAVLLFGGVTAAQAASQADLSLDDRTRCQAALEKVYWSHRTQASGLSFAQAVPEAVIRRRAEDGLLKTEALRRFWGVTATPDQLQAELDRMVANSQSPERLRELFAAGGPTPLPEGVMGVDVNDERAVLTGSRLLDLDTNEITEVPVPPGNWQGFVGAALSNGNDFGGYILGYSGCSTFPMRYRQAVGWGYLGGCATTTSATAIHHRGDALLYYYSTTSGVHFVDEGYYALGGLIDPSQGEWYVQPGGANGINNARQIVAAARQGLSGPIGAILMTRLTAARSSPTASRSEARTAGRSRSRDRRSPAIRQRSAGVPAAPPPHARSGAEAASPHGRRTVEAQRASVSLCETSW